MKKKSAILAVLLAGVMSFGVMATAGCKKKKPSGDGDDTNITTPDDSQGGNTPGGNTPGGNTPGGNTPGGNTPEEEQPVILTEDTAISLTAGETRALTAAEGTEFTSEHTAVATVDSNGVVSAKTAGVAKVKAKTGNTVVTCTVIVLGKSESGSSATAKDPFSFNESVAIGSVDVSTNPPSISDSNAEEFTVAFSDGAAMQYVANGGLAVEPVGVEKSGSYLQGWYTEQSYTNEYDFSEPVTRNLSLHAKWGNLDGFDLVQGNFESIALEWTGSASTVEYSVHGANQWKAIDSELVRVSGNKVRADVVGITAGSYDVRANGKTFTEIPVKRYDRSGYAHFNYNKGVGAYKDDGTVKDNTLVIYVTEANKNNVLDHCYVNGVKTDISQYMGSAKGIGELLNNRRYSGDDRQNIGIAKLTHVYGAVTVRFIGKVENYVDKDAPQCTITGLTDYNSTGNGGSGGDNGGMARIVNAKNLTIEGVGDDAEINGWGVHFISSTISRAGEDDGIGFEVRNITFNKYPEDAVGMEGEQEGGRVVASVERCWVHNNTFLPGYSKTPTESDKGEGDGSCDFKRGQYFTCSYNYYEFCHKTNLVGAGDDVYQYNLTYHHNMWYQCESRMPLTRRANVHFYNNYVLGDASLAAQKIGALSYVHSLRADCYIFSEGNYYGGCKNVTERSGGVAKSYNNTLASCFGDNTMVTAMTRDVAVASNCKHTGYDGASLENFDTNSSLFYYKNGKTDVEILDDSISARARAVMYSGAQGHGAESLNFLNVNVNEPTSAVTVGGSGKTEINVKTEAGKSDNGVLFIGSHKAIKEGKGSGRLMVFTLTAPAELTVNGTAKDAEAYPQVIRSDGKVFLSKFSGEQTVFLPAGTYVVAAGGKDKEATISAMSFADTEASSEIRVEGAKTAIAAIPDQITRSSGSVIEAAERAYSGLTADEKSAFPNDLYQRLLKAAQGYSDIKVKYAIARINYIGAVTENSENDIKAAETALSALIAAEQSKVTNLSALRAAQAEFEKFATQNVTNKIAALPTAHLSLIVDSRPAIDIALELYNNVRLDYGELSSDQQATVTITGVDGAIETLTKALAPFNVKDLVETLPDKNVSGYYSHISDLKKAYEALTADQQQLITAAEKAKIDEVIADYEAYVSQSKVAIFTSKNPELATNAGFTVKGSYKGKVSFTYDGETYEGPLKMESSTQVSFETSGTKTVRIVLHSGGKQSIKVDGKTYSASNGTIIIENFEEGAHIITRDDGEAHLCYVVIS